MALAPDFTEVLKGMPSLTSERVNVTNISAQNTNSLEASSFLQEDIDVNEGR